MPRPSSHQIELERHEGEACYVLDGQVLEEGEPLEVWTTLGWVLGTFMWAGEPALPWLNLLPSKPNVSQPELQLVILTHTLCRRPRALQTVS